MGVLLSFVRSVLLDGKIYIPRKWLQVLCYVLLPLGLGVVMIILFSTNLREFEHFSVEIGVLGWYLFMAIMFSRPLAFVFPGIKIFRTIVSYRKEMGVACLWVIAAHGIGTMYEKHLLSIAALQNLMGQYDNYLFWGFLGGIGIFILGITSNELSMRILKRGWKILHLLAYPTFLFALIHLTLIYNAYIFYGTFTVLYITLKFLQWRGIRSMIFLSSPSSPSTQ